MISRRIKSENANTSVVLEFARNAVSISSFRRDNLQTLASEVIELQSANHDLSDIQNVQSSLRQSFLSLGLPDSVEASVCLARSIGCVHLIEIPNVPENQIYSVVQLQMEASYGESIEQYAWDYAPLLPIDGSGQRIVIAYSLPVAYLSNLRAILNALNVTPSKISIAETGFSFSQPEPGNLVQRLVYLPDRIEAFICHQGHVLKSHSHSIQPESPCQFPVLLGTLRRLHNSLPKSLQELDAINQFAVAREVGGETDGPTCRTSFEAAALQNTFEQVPFEHYPFFVGPASKSQRSIDLSNPHKPPRAPIGLTSKVSVIAACGLLALASYWGYRKHQSQEVLTQIQKLAIRMAELNEQIAALEPYVESNKLLSEWDTSTIRWNKQIESVSENVAASKELYIVRLQMDQAGEQAITRMEGRAKSTQSILELTRQLAADNPGMTVHPSGIEPSNVDPDFRSQFRIELEQPLNEQTMPTDSVEAKE